MPKYGPFWRAFENLNCGQTILPDKSILLGQKLVENAKIQKFKCYILSNFQTFAVFKIIFKHSVSDDLLVKN